MSEKLYFSDILLSINIKDNIPDLLIVRILTSRYLLYCPMSEACGFYLKVVSLERADIVSIWTMYHVCNFAFSYTPFSFLHGSVLPTAFSYFTWRKAVTGSHERHAVMKFFPQNKSVWSCRIQPHSKLQVTGRTHSNSMLEYNITGHQSNSVWALGLLWNCMSWLHFPGF